MIGTEPFSVFYAGMVDLNVSIITHVIKLPTPFYSIVNNLTTHTWGE